VEVRGVAKKTKSGRDNTSPREEVALTGGKGDTSCVGSGAKNNFRKVSNQMKIFQRVEEYWREKFQHPYEGGKNRTG